MLSKEENEILCRVGPGTAMGKLMREYWIPALMTSELSSADEPPMRLRLLGENLVAFRTTSGRVGIMAHNCPHRGASLFFGRNEQEGLRCVYHGWKFDVSGACVDMPSEPEESNFKEKVRARTYPTLERNGIIWTYMGPRETPPADLPNFPHSSSPDSEMAKTVRECNYFQALEGDIDTIHIGFLHAGHVSHQAYPAGSQTYYALKIRHGFSAVQEHEIGTTYGIYRTAEEEENTDCWRIGHFLLPFYTMAAPGILGQTVGATAWVPIDEYHVMVWGFRLPSEPGKRAVGGVFAAPFVRPEPQLPEGLAYKKPAVGAASRDGFLPDTSDWIGRFRSRQNLANDYLIDRDAQQRKASYTGIWGDVNIEDRAMVESMGPIADRTEERLGTTDAMLIKTRRKLINAAKALQNQGTIPPGVDNPDLYRMFAGGAILRKGINALDYTKDVIFGRAKTAGEGALAAPSQP